MKILLAAASFASKMSGLQRHALNVARCLLLAPEVSTLHLVFAPWQHHFVQEAGFRSDPRLVTHIATINKSSLSRNLWYYRDLPELANRLGVDLVHFSYPMPVNGGAFNCPTLVTLHDMYPYEIPMNFGFPKFIFNRIILSQCLRNIDAVACVSDTTLLRLREYTPPSVWQKALRIHNCVEAEPSGVIETPIRGWRGERFLLSVAQHRRNKNIPLLIQSFHRLLRNGQIPADVKLLVIGIAGPETERIRRLVSSLGLGGSASFHEGVSESELKWCYAQCEAVVCPSLTEGFGLPIAEALLAGCRVVCSDIPAFREVGDGQCHFVALDGNAEAALAAAIVATLNEPKGTQKALRQFSAPVLAKQYTSVYRRLISSPNRSSNARVAASINAAASERLPL
jgi:glycosyltransferase involved in cell wall biosynthesis